MKDAHNSNMLWFVKVILYFFVVRYINPNSSGLLHWAPKQSWECIDENEEILETWLIHSKS